MWIGEVLRGVGLLDNLDVNLEAKATQGKKTDDGREPSRVLVM